MKNKKKYHLPFLVAIPLVLIAMLLAGTSAIDFQMHDTYLVVAKFHFLVLILIILAVKSVLYYFSKHIKFISFFFNADVVLTFVLVLIAFYYTVISSQNVVPSDTIALLFLVLASWILIQLLVGVNYLMLMVSSAKDK